MAQTTSPALGTEADEADQPDPEEYQQPSAANGATNESPWQTLLQADTPDSEKHQRPGGGTNPDGTPRLLTYVTARFVQDRLDAAVGPTNWQDSYQDVPGGVRGGIGIRIPGTDEWVWKWDFGQPTSIEPGKGAHSDAFKRAGVKWGIARDLYDERDEDRPQAVPLVMQGQQPGPVQGQPLAQQVLPNATSPNGLTPAEQAAMQQWVCPIHQDVKIVPGGISKRTQRAYAAFFACPVSGCDQKGGNVPAGVMQA